MGLFSSKKKYTVNVTTQPVFDEDQIPTSALNGIIRGIMQDGDLVENMLESVSQSIGVNASNGFNWLKRQDYPIGFPQSQLKTYISARTEMLQAIAANIGKTITAEYAFMGPLNSMHWGWQHCYSALGYNAATNELTLLSAQTGFKCYLADMVATYLREDYDWMLESNDMGMLDQRGPSPRSGYLPSAPFNTLSGMGQFAAQPAYEVSDVATDDYLTITYEFEQAPGVFIRRGITVSMGNIDNTGDYHQCRYTDSDGKTGFFTYLNGSGTYPAIDRAMLFTDQGLGNFLPWTYFRVKNQPAPDVESAETIAQMSKWCEYLGVNYDTLLDGVHQDGDVEDVAQTLMYFGANPGDKNPACIEYLFKHFEVLHNNSLSQRELVDGLYQEMQAFTSSPSQAQRIADNRFAMTFQYSGIQRQRVPGKIGVQGTWASEYAEISQNSQTYMTQSTTGVGTAQAAPKQPAWIYRHQVLDSVYEEIAVFGLRVNYEVHSKKGFAAGGQDQELLIPVDWSVMRTLGVPAQEQALCRFLRFQVNTVIITKTPWYASSIFKAILIIVAVVITVLSAGAAWQSIVAAAAVGIGALAITVLTYIVGYFAISYGVKLFVKEFGPRIGFLAAIVAIAAAAYGYSADASWASTLTSISSNLTQEAQAVQAGLLQDAVEELQDFQAWAAGQWDNLLEKKEALGLNPMLIGIDAFDVVKFTPSIVIGESPSSFFDRTIHAGNLSAASIETTEYYASSMLQLPQFNATVGDFYNGSIPTD